MVLAKDEPALVIVESPNKKKTISEILKKAGYTNVVVSASVGHIMQLVDDENSWKNTGIYPEDNFRLNIKVNPEKNKVMSELKSQARYAKKIFLASDPDREGHVIAWSLLKFLDVDTSKCYRMVTHEITPKAVVYALENPVPFNDNMVNAGLARLAIDKMLGYALSEWLRLYVGGKSAGRCQSVILLLIALRELAIRDFIPETYYDVRLKFSKNNTEFKAKYYGTEGNPIKRINSLKEVESIVKQCTSDFIIKNVSKKEKKDNPRPPFDTIAFQQEASSKLNLKVKDAQSCAQKLFEGIEINGRHVGLVTYIRTDATDMSPEFIPELKSYIDTTYGDNVFKKPKVGKKQENAQEGHEALRCTDPTMTPDKLSKYIKNDLLVKVYRLIWQRTIASAMPPAIISETTYTIENNGQLFTLISNELVDPGYKVVYSYTDEKDEDDQLIKETFRKNEKLKNCSISADDKQTKPEPRYKEPTIIKEIQKNGVGRPSTTAGLIETVLSEKRNYCVMDGKELVPTKLGITVATTLNRCFPDIINVEYTSKLERELDLIAEGKLDDKLFLKHFYTDLINAIAKNTEGTVVTEDKFCPECGKKLIARRNRWGNLFYGCTGYPSCHYLEDFKEANNK